MIHKKLYKLNSNGKSIQTWEIHISEDDKTYWTVSGKVDGKMTKAAPHAVTPKVNRSQREQVILEVSSKISLQQRKKYVEDINDVGSKADGALPGYSAMLAKKWEDQHKKIQFPCIVQPKLDGVRCLATKDGLFSRGRKPIESCLHVVEALKPFFEEFPDAQLDGELYAHEFKHDFEKIIKAVRKSAKRAKPEDLALQAKVQYHIYDCPRIEELNENDKFVDRYISVCRHIVKTFENPALVLVRTDDVADEENLAEYHAEFLRDGYEGTMVRNTWMPYEGKRSSNLLKMKDFDEDEFIIIGMNEGKGGLAGHAGALVLKTPDGTEFRAKLQGSFDRLKWIWHNQSEVIGKMCTIAYQGLTNKEHVPRFPVAKDVRGLEDRSDWL